MHSAWCMWENKSMSQDYFPYPTTREVCAPPQFTVQSQTEPVSYRIEREEKRTLLFEYYYSREADIPN